MDEKRQKGGGAPMAARRGSKSARILKVIAVETVIGSGVETDPNRVITELWSLDGELIAVMDPWKRETGMAR